MTDDDIRDLEERLLSDDDLREEFRQSPHEVLERHGISLSDEESENLHDADLAGQSHEELKAKLQSDGLAAMW